MAICSAFEAGAPGFVAITDAVPAVDRSLAGMATVTWLASTMVVVRYEPFQVTATPRELPPINPASA